MSSLPLEDQRQKTLARIDPVDSIYSRAGKIQCAHYFPARRLNPDRLARDHTDLAADRRRGRTDDAAGAFAAPGVFAAVD
jgi:hypothetical protein